MQESSSISLSSTHGSKYHDYNITKHETDTCHSHQTDNSTNNIFKSKENSKPNVNLKVLNNNNNNNNEDNINKSYLSWLFFIPKNHSSSNENLDKNYKAFKTSNYIYFCGGLFRTSLTSPLKLNKKLNIPVLPFTLTLIILPIIFYSIFEAYWFWFNVSPAIVILFCYCWLQMFLNSLKAAFLDPGILPKNIHIVDNLEKDGLPHEYHNWINLPGPNGNNSIYIKYCDTCYIWRPVRASHCSKCGVCVTNMDHHCPWLGNCIGQRNYWYFINFLLFAFITEIYLIIMSFYKLDKSGLNNSRWSLFLGIYSSLCLPYSTLLLFFHLCLGFTGITTREYFSPEHFEGNNHIQDVCLNPFNSKNGIKNIGRQWFRRRGTPNVNITKNYAANDMRFKEIHVGALLV